MQASILLVGRTRNRTVQQLEHVRGRTKIAGQLLDEIRKFCQATFQWVNSSVGASQPSTRCPLSERIYGETENPCEGGQLSRRAQSKPASECLELYDVRDKPHPFPLKKNISWTNIKTRLLPVLDASQVTHTTYKPTRTKFSSTTPPGESHSPIARCLATNDFGK